MADEQEKFGGIISDFREAGEKAALVADKVNTIIDKLTDGSLGMEILIGIEKFPIYIRLK